MRYNCIESVHGHTINNWKSVHREGQQWWRAVANGVGSNIPTVAGAGHQRANCYVGSGSVVHHCLPSLGLMECNCIESENSIQFI